MTKERDAAQQILACLGDVRDEMNPRAVKAFQALVDRLQPPEPDEATAFWQEMMARSYEDNGPTARNYRQGMYSAWTGPQAAIAFTRETFARIRNTEREIGFESGRWLERESTRPASPEPDHATLVTRDALAAWGERVLAVDQGEYDGSTKFQAAVRTIRQALTEAEARGAARSVPKGVLAWAKATLKARPFYTDMPITKACQYIISLNEGNQS